jgi:FKBP-type peptidyl-prolyl cis-trans isomerase FkpA
MSDITAVPLRPVGKSGVAALWIGVAVLLAAGVGGAYAASQKAVVSVMSPNQFLAANAKHRGVKTTPSGLQYKIVAPGAGPAPTASDVAQIDYRGTLISGAQFDASKPGEPVALPVGAVVPGFSEALQLMPKGSKFRVWIPPQLGYGERAAGPIPANSVLVFDITMHDFQPMPPEMPQPGM